LVINKSISLVSDYEYSGDNADATTTILDGNESGPVIFMKGRNDQFWTIYICGFIIQHGIGYDTTGLTVPIQD